MNMDFEAMEKELTNAFVKATELDDFKCMVELNRMKANINRYKKKDRPDKLEEAYKIIVKIMGNHDYMYWEKEHIKWLLKGNKIEDFTF